MKARKPETIADQIQAAQKRINEWPDWMRGAAYFSGNGTFKVNEQSKEHVDAEKKAEK